MFQNKLHKYEIIGIVGAPGVGKTAIAQYIVLDAIAKGIPVYSNRALAGAYKINCQEIGKFDFIVNQNGFLKRGGVLIIDEAGIDFNNREYKSFNIDMIEFFKLHRHYKLDIYVITQGIDIDLTIRRLITKWYKVVPYKIFNIISTNYAEMLAVEQQLMIENGEWKMKYEIKKGVTLKIDIMKMVKLFNSFEIPELPKIEFKKWYDLDSNYFLNKKQIETNNKIDEVAKSEYDNKSL